LQDQRNGKGAKTVYTDDGRLRIDVPRDRDASFEPVLIPRHARRFTGFDDKIRGHSPDDEAATKLIWLALRNITAKWSRSAYDWKSHEPVCYPFCRTLCSACQLITQPVLNTKFRTSPGRM